MNRPQQPTTYGRQSQILRESIGGLPELTLAVNNYRNYLNRLLARLKDPKTVQVDQKVVAKMVRETTRHLGMVLSVARDNPNSIGFAHYLEIVKAYLIIQVQFLGKQVNVDQLMPEDNGTNDFLRLLSQFSLSDEQRHMLGEFITNLETQKTSLEALIKPLYPKFQQMIAASRQEITDVIRHPKKDSGDSAIFGATTERIHEPTKKVEKPQKISSRVAPVTQQFTELNVPGTSEDQEADELKIEFLPDSGKIGLPPQPKSSQEIDQKIVRLLDKEGFEVVRKLGEGGMGVVYLAKDKNLGGALVAIKRILRQPGIDEMEWQDLTGRFRREGVAMAELTRKYPKGFTPIYGSFEIEGDPCIVMKCEQGPVEGISDEAISKAITNGRKVFEFSRANEWYLELEGFVAGHAHSISIESVLHLAEMALHSKIIKKGTAEFEILSHIKRKKYPGQEITKDQLPKDVLEAAVRLKEVVEKHFFPVPVEEVMKYVKISKLHEGVTDGDKYMRMVTYLKEYCGENFPTDVYTQIWMLLYRDFLGTMKFMHDEGYINRDIKPSNLIVTSEASTILFALLDQIMLLTPADREVKKEKVRAAFEKALQNMKALDRSEEGSGLIKIIDLGLAKEVGQSEKALKKKKKKTQDAPLDAYLTQAGTIMGTPAYMTRSALMNSENESPEADFHASGMAWMAMWKGEDPVKIGRNHIDIGLNLDTWAEEADKARAKGALAIEIDQSSFAPIRKALKRYLSKKSKVPKMALSLAEKDPDTFAYFEEHHPELAAWLQRATWLTKYKNMTEIDWEEALAYTERQLYPPQDSRRKVGVAVSLALAASAVVGGIGYKIQSDRNAIAIAQKALEEKMNAIRLRVTQTKEMPESTIEEMEAKISFILQTKQFLNGQKELDPSLNIDAEISELDRVLDSINRLLFDALIVSIEEKLRTFDVKNVGEDYFQKIYDQFARLKELDVRKQNNEQISMLEKKVELFNVGWCLSVEEQRYVSFPREDKESNPRAQIVFRQAVSLAREFIDIYIQLPHRTEFVSSGKIPDDKIVASTNLHEVNDYVREIMAMPFPENFRMAAEYIQRVAHVSQNMSLDRNSMMELFAHSLFKMVRWLGGIGFQKLHSYPAEIQANNLVDELLRATECSLLMLRRYNEGLDTVFGENEWSLLLELRKKPNKTSLELEQLRTLERLNEINYMNLQIVLNYLKLHHLKSINY